MVGAASRPDAWAAAGGMVLDGLLGEPPARWHPVAAYGSAMARLEHRCYADSKGRGTVYLLVGLAVPLVAGGLVRRAGRGAPALAVYTVLAGRSLHSAATDVHQALSRGDLEQARALLPTLVGRDPSGLDEKEISRAVVESVAENTVDAVVAPLFWAVAGGPSAALAHRAINTLDAMVGHLSPRYARFGWAAAKTDDAVAWVPARLTALLVAAGRPSRRRAVLRAVRTQAPAHPSPNAGVAEAAFAAALDLRLGGVNIYDGRLDHRPELGTGRPPGPDDIPRAISLSRRVGLAATGAAVAVGALAPRRVAR